MDTHAAFAFYESIRHRLPTLPVGGTPFPSSSRHADSIVEIADQFDVFVFDAYGVLNVGGTVIPGAVESVSKLNALGKSLFILTNGSSQPLNQVKPKFDRLGYDFPDSHIVSSRYCTEAAVLAYDRQFQKTHQRPMLWGAIIGMSSSVDDLAVNAIALTDNAADYDRVDGFVFLSAGTWNEGRQSLLEAAITQHQAKHQTPRPFIVGNPDVVAPDGGHFSLEPGLFSHRLINATNAAVEFHGKPFPSVFDEVKRRIGEGVSPARIAMVGDTLHTDVIGGAAAGWSTVLVSDHGLFSGHDVLPFIERSGYIPDWIVPTL